MSKKERQEAERLLREAKRQRRIANSEVSRITALMIETAAAKEEAIERGVDLWHRVEEREAGWRYALECRQARVRQLKAGWQFQVDRAVRAEALAERRREAWARVDLAIRTGVDPATANGPPENAAFFTKDELIAYIGYEAHAAIAAEEEGT